MSLRTKILLIAVVVVALLALIAYHRLGPPPRPIPIAMHARTLRFPPGTSMTLAEESGPVVYSISSGFGEVYIRDAGSSDTAAWSRLAPARGPVSIPGGKEVRIEISPAARHVQVQLSVFRKILRKLGFRVACLTFTTPDLSPLAVLRPDDVYSLKCGGDLPVVNRTISDEQLAFVGHLISLRELDLTERALESPDSLAFLRNLPTLETLSLSGAYARGPALGHLKKAKSLRNLDLSRQEVSDAGLAALTNLKSLRTLDLSTTDFTDTGLVHLRELPALTDLNLSGTRITRAAVVHLKAMKTLRTLTVSGTPLAAPEMQSELREALPECRFITRSIRQVYQH